jgi:hypothetical protein
MAQALAEAIAAIGKLPPDEQERIGRWLLDEIASEREWEARLTSSPEALSKLAAEARANLAAGEVTELDPDRL